MFTQGSLSSSAADSALFTAVSSMSLIPRTAAREHDAAGLELLAAAADAALCAAAAAAEERALGSAAAEQFKHLQASRQLLARQLTALQVRSQTAGGG